MASYKGFLTIAKVADGTPGESGNTLYTWVVYSKGSKQPTLNEEITFTPTKDTAWMGILTNQITPPPSTVPPSLSPGAILWTEIKGKDGEDSTNKYSLDMSNFEILKFMKKDEVNEKINTIFSPNTIYFAPQKEIGAETRPKISISISDITLEFVYYNTDNGASATEILSPDEIAKVVTEEVIMVGPDGAQTPVKTGLWIFDVNKLSETTFEFDILLKYEGFFKITVDHQDAVDTFILEELIALRYGTSNDMAVFQLHAGGFNAAIQSTNLSFAENGLVLKNGAFTIVKDSEDGAEEKLLYADEEGNLVLKGTIYANDGIFSGLLKSATLEAVQGKIGGFNINEGTLTSTAGSNKMVMEGGSQVEKFVPYLTFDGETGRINAENIELGTGAIISDYIKLGTIGSEVLICNPDKYNKVFLRVKSGNTNTPSIALRNDGVANFGNIEIDGATSTMRGEGWRITPDVAEFSNAVISGAIKTVIFEKGINRTVGGRMIFKDSFYCKNTSSSTNELIIEDITGITFGIKDGKTETTYLLVTTPRESGSSTRTLCQVTNVIPTKEGENTGKIILNKKVSVVADSSVIIILGSGPLNQTPIKFNDWVIGINSSSSIDPIFNLQQNSITISSLISQDNNSTIKATPEVVIGDLSEIEELKTMNNETDGHLSGLYANSVFLTGMLQTKYREGGEEKYAGMNTLSQVKFNREIDELVGVKDSSSIIFWAGSSGRAGSDIQNAKFQVTSNGTLYAQQGVFSGAILTDATIQAKKLIVDSIHGQTNRLPLYIQDADGIAMQSADGKTGFSLTSESADFMSPVNGQSLTLKPKNIEEMPKQGMINLDYNNITLTKESEVFKIGITKMQDRLGLNFSTINRSLFTLTPTDFVHFTDVRHEDSSIFFTEIGEWRPHKSSEQIDGYDFYIN